MYPAINGEKRRGTREMGTRMPRMGKARAVGATSVTPRPPSFHNRDVSRSACEVAGAHIGVTGGGIEDVPHIRDGAPHARIGFPVAVDVGKEGLVSDGLAAEQDVASGWGTVAPPR